MGWSLFFIGMISEVEIDGFLDESEHGGIGFLFKDGCAHGDFEEDVMSALLRNEGAWMVEPIIFNGIEDILL